MTPIDKLRRLWLRPVSPLAGVLLVALSLLFIFVMLRQWRVFAVGAREHGAAAIIGRHELPGRGREDPLAMEIWFERDGIARLRPLADGRDILGRWQSIGPNACLVTTTDQRYRALVFTLEGGRPTVRFERPRD